jgi:drug/metabolite transporter (DMT)-like permease
VFIDFGKLIEVFVVVLFTSSGQLLLRTVMKDFDVSSGFSELLNFAIKNPLLWVALGLYGISTLLWIRVLARFPVSSVYPMVAVGYVLVTLGGTLFLGERVPLQSWIALAIICFGVLLLANTSGQSPV